MAVAAPTETTAIAVALSRHFDPFKHQLFPNVFVSHGWEADLLLLRESGWAEEIEIKVSRADYRREFEAKAFKHDWLVGGIPRTNAGQRGTAWRARNSPGVLTGEREPHCVKRYWIALPARLAAKLEPEIPSHAGVLAVDGRDVIQLRTAPNLRHSRKVTPEERDRFLVALYYRFWKLRADRTNHEPMFEKVV